MMSRLRKMCSCICSKSGSTDSTEALNDFDEPQEDVIGRGETGTFGTELLPSTLIHGSNANGFTATGGPADSTDKTPDQAQASGFDVVFKEMQELQEDLGRLVICLESLRIFHQSSYVAIMEALQEQQCRCNISEEQLTDFAELFQNEISNLTEELASMEEKIAHLCHDRVTSSHEALKAFQALISNMEQQQQSSWESTTGQTLLGKLIDVLLVVLIVFLGFVATAVNHFLPLMKTPGRMLSMLLFVVLFHFLWGHWNLNLEIFHCLIFHCPQHPEREMNQKTD